MDKDTTPPDPNRPYYDAHSNLYDYKGNLIKAAPSAPIAPKPRATLPRPIVRPVKAIPQPKQPSHAKAMDILRVRALQGSNINPQLSSSPQQNLRVRLQ